MNLTCNYFTILGLGKTLEVLGCVLLNPRTEFPKFDIEIDNTKFVSNKKKEKFSCVCGNVPKDISSNSQVIITLLVGLSVHIACYSFLRKHILAVHVMFGHI